MHTYHHIHYQIKHQKLSNNLQDFFFPSFTVGTHPDFSHYRGLNFCHIELEYIRCSFHWSRIYSASATSSLFPNFGGNTQCSVIRKKVKFQKYKNTFLHFQKWKKKSIFAPEKSPKVAFLVVLNFFLVQKLIFCHF